MNRLERARQYEKEHQKEIRMDERPVYHITPAVGWLNDPNGFSSYGGKYHLFYQYYPYATKWGRMHWGHYTTEDFIRWEMLPAALAPDEEYESGCYSGSAAETPDGKHLLMYTAHLETGTDDEGKTVTETQCIAVGDGLDYEKYEGNPVLTSEDLPEGSSPSDFRDPKIWREGNMYYAVTVNMAEDGSGQVLLFSSEDGFHWEFVSVLEKNRNRHGQMWECPDYFHLGDKKVIIVSPMNMQKEGMEFHSGHGVIGIIGSAKEGVFHREMVQSIDYGFDFYAPQTVETSDGRRVMIAWMQSWESSACSPAGAKWFCMMTVPRELFMRNGRICQMPVRELEDYRKNRVFYENCVIEGMVSLDGVSGRCADLEVTLKLGEAEKGMFSIFLAADGEIYTEYRYNIETGIMIVDRGNSGIRHDITCTREFEIGRDEGTVRLRFLIDRFSIELFANGGEQAFTTCIYDTPQSAGEIRFQSNIPVMVDVEKYDVAVE